MASGMARMEIVRLPPLAHRPRDPPPPLRTRMHCAAGLHIILPRRGGWHSVRSCVDVDSLGSSVWNVENLLETSSTERRHSQVQGHDPAYVTGPGGAGPFGPAAKGVIAMLAIVVLMLVYLTPVIVNLGRELDFVPRDPPPPGMSRFWVLHAAYTSLEMLKLVAGLGVAWVIARDPR